MKKINLLMIAACMITSCNNSPSGNDEDRQIDEILNNLSLEEKAGQLNLIAIEGEPSEEQLQLIREGKVGSVIKTTGVENLKRLQKVAVDESKSGIPILFQEDVIHGYKTIAPIPLAEAASWDLNAIQNSAAVAAREAVASGIMLTYAPMVDVCRDPRWGRILEGAGEDPYLGSLVAAARVRGFQETNGEGGDILACVKHFAGYGAALGGRDYNIMDFSERELREVYLPPFQAAIDAGVASLMCAYSTYDGEPLTASKFMMKELLRDEMGFEGLAMTDWQTINNLMKIGVAADELTATEMAINCEVDMDMTSEKYVDLLPVLVRAGRISEEQVDLAVRRVLVLKQKAGLLKDPWASLNVDKEKTELLSAQNIEETQQMAMKSMVLLKNDAQTLPISKKVKRIAVIGPYAKANKDMLGWWSCMGEPEDVVNYYDGIKAAFDDVAQVSYAQGCDIDKFEKVGADKIPAAVRCAQNADVVIMVLGESEWMSGEGGGVASLHLPGLQQELLDAVAKTGTPIVTIINAGRPYVLTDVAEKSDALLCAWMPGTTGGTALAEILSGKFNPQGKLPVTFPCHQGQIPIYHSYKKSSHDFIPGITEERYTTTYRDVQNEPLYPFGYGLSYTTFEYSVPKLSSSVMTKDAPIRISVEVSNSGDVLGTEVVQLYVRDKIASVSRPMRELKDFALVELQPGETKSVSFEVTIDKLAFIGPGKTYDTIAEAGEFDLFIGSSSADCQQVSFQLDLAQKQIKL